MGQSTSGAGGGAAKGSAMTAEQKKIEAIKNQEYQFHATRGSSVWSIYEQGLKPTKGHMGKGVYMAPSEQEALDWTQSSSTGGTTLMRVKTQALKDKYSWGVIDSSESTADKTIKPKDIEIFARNVNGGTWMSLQKYQQTFWRSYEMWKRGGK